MEVRQKNYEIFTSTDVDDFMITSTADLHYDERFEKQKLLKLKDEILANESNYNCLIGDIINANNIENFDQLLLFLEQISKYSKTIISFGNHEMIDIVNKKAVEQYPREFIKLLQGLKNVIVLNNSYYQENNIEFAGITNSFAYYEKEKPEDFIAEVNENLDKPFNPNNFNILLSHSPVNIISAKGEANILDNCDMVLSGHNHNGLVPPSLEKQFKTIGLINHRKDIFPKYSRENFVVHGTEVIINGGITKFSSYSKFKGFNKHYFMDIDKIQVRSLKR